MKRMFDLLISIIFLILCGPLLIVIAVMVRAYLGKPIIFKQKRPGLDGKPFILYKFRSMTDEKDEEGNLLPDALRFGKFSNFLRKSSMDELPELLNVLKGEMSIVGPRPLLMQYLGLYNAEQVRRLEVKPGITGWAQVNGRNAISWEEKFKLDIWYVDHQSLLLDLKIILLTIKQVLLCEKINQEGHVTAREFLGNNDHE